MTIDLTSNAYRFNFAHKMTIALHLPRISMGSKNVIGKSKKKSTYIHKLCYTDGYSEFDANIFK